MSDFAEGYVEVSERIEAFYEKYPDGSLQGTWDVQEIGAQILICYRAVAYRSPDDPTPGIGHASEPFPGQTPFTQDSELMNAETSAWGRAIAALGFKVHEGIASANEVRARAGDRAPAGDGQPPTPAQKGAITKAFRKAGITDEVLSVTVDAIGGVPLTKPGASKVLDRIYGGRDEERSPEEIEAAIKEMVAEAGTQASDVPADEEGLPPGDSAVPPGQESLSQLPPEDDPEMLESRAAPVDGGR